PELARPGDSSRGNTAKGVSETPGCRPGRSGPSTWCLPEPVERDHPRQAEHHGGHRLATLAISQDITATLDAAASRLGSARGDAAAAETSLMINPETITPNLRVAIASAV